MSEERAAFSAPMTAYEEGWWEAFESLTNTYYGKQYYFLEENGMVYSRLRGKYSTFDEAFKEFIGDLREDDDA